MIYLQVDFAYIQTKIMGQTLEEPQIMQQNIDFTYGAVSNDIIGLGSALISPKRLFATNFKCGWFAN